MNIFNPGAPYQDEVDALDAQLEQSLLNFDKKLDSFQAGGEPTGAAVMAVSVNPTQSMMPGALGPAGTPAPMPMGQTPLTHMPPQAAYYGQPHPSAGKKPPITVDEIQMLAGGGDNNPNSGVGNSAAQAGTAVAKIGKALMKAYTGGMM